MSLFTKELDATAKKVVKGVLRHKAEVNEDGFLTRDQIFTAFAECGHWAADIVKGVLRHKAEVNEDGFLTRDQIFTAFAECGHWAADSDLEFLDKVLDSDGKVHVEEVLENIDNETISVSCVTGEELNEAFKMFDKYGDGTIRRYELMQILKAQGQFQFDEEEAKEIIDELTEKYNPKDSGKLQYPEYVQQFTSTSSPEEMEQIYMMQKYKL